MSVRPNMMAGQLDGIIAPLGTKYVAEVKARIREAQNELHFKYEISEKEAEARRAAERSAAYQATHPKLMEMRAAMVKPKGTKKKAAIGPFLGLLARTYTSETSGPQSLQVQLKKKIKQVNLKLARRMRTSESDYNDQQPISTTKDDDPDLPAADDVEDGDVEMEDGSDAESAADETPSKLNLEAVQEEEEVVDTDEETDTGEADEEEEEEEEDDGDVEDVDNPVDERDEDIEEEEEEEEEEMNDDQDEDEEEQLDVAATKLCIRAMKRLIIEEGI